MSAHTPGPWHASRKSGYVNCINSRVIAEVMPREGSREANALLLAAAPDLLACVQDYIALIDNTEHRTIGKMDKVKRRMRNAIAKATGAA